MSTLTTLTELNYPDTKHAMDLIFRSRTMNIIMSPPGQGKSSLVDEYVAEQGPDYGYFEINCALANQPDFMGWFYRHTFECIDTSGNKRTIETGKYTYPYFLFDKRSGRPAFEFQRGVLKFEEYGQCDPDLKRALGQTCLEYRVGQYKLPDAFDIVALSNLPGGRDAVGRDFDFMINRRAETHMRQDADTFLIYAHRIGMLNMTMAFSALPHHKVFTGEVPKDQGPFLSPRSLEALDRFMKVILDAKIKLDDPIVRTAAAGYVGMGAAHQFLAFAALQYKLPSIDQIVKDPDGTPVPEQADQRMFLVFNMADAAEKKNVRALTTYLNRMPSDMSVAFYKNALHRDITLMGDRSFGDWAIQNKALISVVNKR